jgi:uncharacterized protein YacL
MHSGLIFGLIVRSVAGASFGFIGLLLGGVFEPRGFMPWGLSSTVVGVVAGVALAPYLLVAPIRGVLQRIGEVQGSKFLAALSGLILGLVIAVLVSIPLARLSGWPGTLLPLILSGVFALLGIAVMLTREQDVSHYLTGQNRGSRTTLGPSSYAKVLMDTSAIIDGRIADIIQAGFINGTMVIPRFVLDELRHVADSSNSLRRNRGRRGLEVLSNLRKEATVPIQILDVDSSNGMEVDGHLVKLAKSMGAAILTTDFNLNRVASIQGVKVLNVNDLANAIKPLAIPGENLEVRVIQEGTEAGQGVGFLDNGAMVVVEGGRRFLNTRLDVSVTRVHQTASGCLIFAQPKER